MSLRPTRALFSPIRLRALHRIRLVNRYCRLAVGRVSRRVGRRSIHAMASVDGVQQQQQQQRHAIVIPGEADETDDEEEEDELFDSAAGTTTTSGRTNFSRANSEPADDSSSGFSRRQHR